MSKLVLTVDELREVLQIGRSQAYKLVKEPGFPSFYIGNKVFVNKELLQEWLNKQCE